MASHCFITFLSFKSPKEWLEDTFTDEERKEYFKKNLIPENNNSKS